ncbi:MAG: class I SAM-dependent methyltransferase [Gemmatimonadetes bacterium]|nr:class I SAM-dependent methyltransferase [Gemmatimonadota bacterium]
MRHSKTHPADPELPYNQLAPIYDHVMRHVDYDRWADYIQSIFERFGATPKEILELACGTGVMACILNDRGYRMTGMDRSENMIAVARQKAQDGRRPIAFQAGDMVSMPVSGSYDAVLCLYDSINYIMDEADIAAMLNGLRGVLNSGGLFVFDVCTEINSRRYFHNQVDQESNGDYSYVRRCEYVPESRVQVNEFQLTFHRGGKRYSTRERHEQRIYPVARLAEICRQSSYRVLGAFDGFSFQGASERSNRVHYVVRPA